MREPVSVRSQHPDQRRCRGKHRAALRVVHGVAPVLQRPSIEILDHVREWIAGRDSP